jgi:HPt (histidine-containing phosphotransfer) domain-containing protein
VAGSPADGQPAAVQAAFARLRERFVAGLPQRWLEIDAAGSGPARAAALHRLVGAAASYGLVAVGEAARRAESLAAATDPPSTAALAAALAELGRCIDDAVTVR